MVFGLTFTVTDVKHYAYCPAIIYIKHVLGYREPATDYMEMGREQHLEKAITPLIAKYKPVRVLRNPMLECPRIGLTGRPDIVLVKRHNLAVVAEIKWAEPARGGVKRDHKLQVGAYALLVECVWGYRTVAGAVLYLRPEPRILEVRVTGGLLREVRRVLEDMRRIVSVRGVEEPRVPRGRCSGCNYKAVCPFYG